MGTMFEPGFDEFTQGFLRPGNTGKNKFSVMDEVNVPNKPGKYVLGWRWDCEEADQVWNSCADIEIVDHSVPVLSHLRMMLMAHALISFLVWMIAPARAA